MTTTTQGQQLVHNATHKTTTQIYAPSILLPLAKTLITATNKNQLKGIPLLNDAKMIKNYLAPLLASSEGRLSKDPTYLRSIRTKDKKKEEMEEEMNMDMQQIDAM